MHILLKLCHHCWCFWDPVIPENTEDHSLEPVAAHEVRSATLTVALHRWQPPAIGHHHHCFARDTTRSRRKMSFPCLPPSNLLLFPPILRIQPEANSQGSLGNVVCRFLVLSDKEMSYEGWEWRSQAIEQPWLVILLLINAFP